MLDFRTETFITVCKYMNFTKAAEKLNITQPAVSQHIKYIEQNYGIVLFEYKGKKMIKTKECEILLESVTTMKNDETYLKELFKDKKLNKRKLRFGVTRTIGEYAIVKSVANIMKIEDNLELKLEVDNTHILLDRLNNGDIDFAIVEGYFEKTQYDYLTFSKERFIAVCSKDSGLLSQINNKKLYINDVLNQNILLREKGSGSRDILEKNLKERNYIISDFKNQSEISNISIIKELVKQNCGITFIYEIAVREELDKGILIEIPLENFNVTHDFTFIWRKKSIFQNYYKRIYNILNNNSEYNNNSML